eukprot:1949855-Rhodomonas_salina.11
MIEQRAETRTCSCNSPQAWLKDPLAPRFEKHMCGRETDNRCHDRAEVESRGVRELGAAHAHAMSAKLEIAV